MGRASLREKIIESGVTTLHRGGFNASGVREITSAAGVPQGSFTNHFRSKEAFAGAVLDRYYAHVDAIMAATLRDTARTPIERLGSYFDTVTALLNDGGWRHGCLISNMGLETAEQSEPLRLHLARLFKGLAASFAQALRAGQETKAIRDDLDPDELADVLLSAWHGAMMRMKIDRSPAPLERFRRIFLATLLVGPTRE